MAASALSARTADRATLAEINITPLVDVMLVLLVIFMVTAPALTQTLSMRLPAGGEPTTIPPRVELSVSAAGEFALDGRTLSDAGLRSALADVAMRSPQSVVEIAASRDADYQAFTTALAAARSSGLDNITLAR
jgi:biopolymer transport protein ExbD